MNYLVIDSGTTNSRIRLCNEERVIKSVTIQAGARDVSISGSSEILKKALKDGIEDIYKNCTLETKDIEAIIASGMITSNVGLVEIPHIPSPAGILQLSQNLSSFRFPEIIDKDILFIPGVKTGFSEGNLLDDMDIMRGEEAEVFGYLGEDAEKESDEILFMHYGSHHKCIKVSGGKISECRTAITGELMMAAYQDTILKSSLIPIDEIIPVVEWVRKGVDAVEASGFGRALFSIRILDVMEKRNKQVTTSFYLGTLLALDLELVSTLITEETKGLVLYGKTLFPSITESIIKERYPKVGILIIDEEEADLLSVKGAIKIYKSSQAKRD